MTRKKFKNVLRDIVIIYVAFIGVGILITFVFPVSPEHYEKFTDLVAFLSVLIVAWFTYSYQKRNSFLNHLQITWGRLIKTANEAISFTYLTPPEKPQFDKVMMDMSIVIDDLQSLYKNFRENKTEEGIYPFQSLEKMKTAIKTYYREQMNYREDQKDAKRSEIKELWRNAKNQVMEEFDRSKL